MAKNMARIENNLVVNIEWCSDSTAESDSLKDPAGHLVAIGDTYENGRFYREGVMLLTPIEELQQQITDLDNAYEEGVNSV